MEVGTRVEIHSLRDDPLRLGANPADLNGLTGEIMGSMMGYWTIKLDDPGLWPVEPNLPDENLRTVNQ